MTDLHTHILPCIDDGAKDLYEALALLKLQKQQNVRNIALTSHFDCEKIDVSVFLQNRAAAYQNLISFCNPVEFDIQLKLGAEVQYSPHLRNIDYQRLCMEGTDLLLMELPVNQYPSFLDYTLCDFRANGITPLIAHVERYSYVLKNPSILYKWISCGAYIQVNAQSVVNSRHKKWILKMIRYGLVHVLCSDTHSKIQRPPNVRDAMDIVAKELGNAEALRLKQNADDLFLGLEPENTKIREPKNICGFWF